jgi:hypothetical protein
MRGRGGAGGGFFLALGCLFVCSSSELFVLSMLASALGEGFNDGHCKVGVVHEGVKGWGAYNPLPEAFHDCDRRGCTSSEACIAKTARDTR